MLLPRSQWTFRETDSFATISIPFNVPEVVSDLFLGLRKYRQNTQPRRHRWNSLCHLSTDIVRKKIFFKFVLEITHVLRILGNMNLGDQVAASVLKLRRTNSDWGFVQTCYCVWEISWIAQWNGVLMAATQQM